MQYRIYAPKHCEVLVDNELIPYNDQDGYYDAIVKKGKHTLTIRRDGCEEQVTAINASDNEDEIKLNMTYTSKHINSGEEAAKELLCSLINKCWSLDDDLSGFSFTSEQDKGRVQSTVDSIIMALSESLSAEYTVGDISFSLEGLAESDESKILRYDSSDGGIVYPFTLTYSYTYSFNSASYSASKEVTKSCTPHIVIEKIDGVWCIKSLYLSLSNGEY